MKLSGSMVAARTVLGWLGKHWLSCTVMFVFFVVQACSVGLGEGSVSGLVTVRDCGLDGDNYNLKPTFFGAEPLGSRLEIRIQRGSDIELFSDGMFIQVRDANRIRNELIGQSIDLSNQLEDGQNELIFVSVYLNDSCSFEKDDEIPVGLVASGGSITFRSIYAPEIDRDEREISARFENVTMVDPANPEARNAVFEGDFRFLFIEGRPAQAFPR